MTYHRPKTLQQALYLAADPIKTVIAGGTDVFPSTQEGRPALPMLDVAAVPELRQIGRVHGAYRFGAAVTWTEVIKADLPPAFDCLKLAAREVGSVQIQNAGTIAGNLCNASPAADGVPPLLALDAKVETASAATGIRTLPLSSFITGPRQTALRPDELVTAIIVPDPGALAGSSFQKLGSRKYLVISIAMVAAIVELDAGGLIRTARIAVGSCSAVAQRLPELERDCIGKAVSEVTVTPEHLAPLAPIDDVRGSADYRHDAARELCLRAIKEAV